MGFGVPSPDMSEDSLRHDHGKCSFRFLVGNGGVNPYKLPTCIIISMSFSAVHSRFCSIFMDPYLLSPNEDP